MAGWIAGAVVASAAIGAGTSMMAADSAASAQEDAANKQAQSQREANEMNYKMFKEGRGSEGSAVLPLYLKTPSGKMFEGQLGEDLISAYGQTAPNMSALKQAAGQTSGAQQAAVGTVNDIFSGGITRKMQANVAPVQQERLALARNSSLDALHKTLNDIDATQAQRGFVGDSYGSRLMKFQAGRQAGADVGAAHLANTQQTADIKNYGDVTLPMQSLTLPATMAQQNANYQFIPSDTYLQQMSQRMQPFNFMKMNPSAFTYQPIPTAPADMSGAQKWSALGNMAGSIGSSAGNYFMQKNMMQNAQNNYTNNMANTQLANMGVQGFGTNPASGIYIPEALPTSSVAMPAASSYGGWGSSSVAVPSTLGLVGG